MEWSPMSCNANAILKCCYILCRFNTEETHVVIQSGLHWVLICVLGSHHGNKLEFVEQSVKIMSGMAMSLVGPTYLGVS